VTLRPATITAIRISTLKGSKAPLIESRAEFSSVTPKATASVFVHSSFFKNLWLRNLESNKSLQLKGLMCYRYTIPRFSKLRTPVIACFTTFAQLLANSQKLRIYILQGAFICQAVIIFTHSGILLCKFQLSADAWGSFLLCVFSAFQEGNPGRKSRSRF